jgi:hypothetical protein
MFIAALLSAPFTSVIAQEQPPPLEPGQRVRVSAPAAFGDDWQVATIEALRGDTLVLTIDSLMSLLPLGVVTRLEASRGRRSNTVAGAVSGGVLLGGVVLGFGLAFDPPIGDRPTTGEVAKGTAIGAVIGAGLGALIGSGIKKDRWEEVPLDQLRVSVVPQRDGRFGLGLSVRF